MAEALGIRWPRLESAGRLLHKRWDLYDVEHVVFQPRRMTPERLQAGLEWAWRQSYSWRSTFNRLSGAPWSIMPLWLSLNFGYRFYAQHLHEKTKNLYRDAAYIEQQRRANDTVLANPATANRSCGSAQYAGAMA